MTKEQVSRQEFIQLSRHSVPLIKPYITEFNKCGFEFNQDDLIGLQLANINEPIVRSYLLSLAIRKAGDMTGILAPLIGVSQSKEETQEIVQQIGNQLWVESQPSVLEVIFGNKQPDISDLLAIDQLTGWAVSSIKSVAVERGLAKPEFGNMTYEAYEFREKNRQALGELEKEFGGLPKLLNRELIFSLGSLSDITQMPIIPKIDASPLLTILPNKLNNNLKPSQELPEPLKLIARLNMSGSDLARFFAGLANTKLTQQKMEYIMR